MDNTPLHEWLRQRLKALLDEAQAAGFARDAAEAVLIDLATSTDFNKVLPEPEEPDPPR